MEHINILKSIAIGDSIGLPWEGLKPQPNKKVWKQSFLFGWGITSDDTQHAVLTQHAIEISQGDPNIFRKVLGTKLALWFLCLPPGIGFATLRSCLKLCVGLRSPQSGIFSAGNGPAMRSPIIGWNFWQHPELLETYVKISTETTHTDPKAYIGALALAKTMAILRKNPQTPPQELETIWKECGQEDPNWKESLQATNTCKTAEEFLKKTNQRKGTGGYIYHTVPTALWVWKNHTSDFKSAIEESLRLGGDTDSLAAIVGALSAASGGTSHKEWEKVIDMPSTQSRPSIPLQVGYNLLALTAIFFIHIPLRIWHRCTR